MKNKILTCLALSAFAVTYTSAQTTFYVDLGKDDDQTTTGNYNNITVAGSSFGTSAVTLQDSSGSTAAGYGLTASLSGSFGANSDGTSLAPYSTGYALTANQDFIYVASGANVLTVTLSNLDDSLTYDLTLFGSRNASGTRFTQYDLTAGGIVGSTQRTLNVVDNTGNTVSFDTVTPDINGEISFTVQAQSGSTFGYINALEITAIPEPSTYALLIGITGLSYMMLRRRKA